jgi:hypothetical protein
MKFNVREFFKKSVEKIQFSLKLDKNKGQEQYTFLSYVAYFFLE